MISGDKVQDWEKWFTIWKRASGAHDKPLPESQTTLCPILSNEIGALRNTTEPSLQVWVSRLRCEPSAHILTSGWRWGRPSSSSVAGPSSRSGVHGSSECCLRCSGMAGHPSGSGCVRSQSRMSSGRRSTEQGWENMRTSTFHISEVDILTVASESLFNLWNVLMELGL